MNQVLLHNVDLQYRLFRISTHQLFVDKLGLSSRGKKLFFNEYSPLYLVIAHECLKIWNCKVNKNYHVNMSQITNS